MKHYQIKVRKKKHMLLRAYLSQFVGKVKKTNKSNTHHKTDSLFSNQLRRVCFLFLKDASVLQHNHVPLFFCFKSICLVNLSTSFIFSCTLWVHFFFFRSICRYHINCSFSCQTVKVRPKVLFFFYCFGIAATLPLSFNVWLKSDIGLFYPNYDG